LTIVLFFFFEPLNIAYEPCDVLHLQGLAAVGRASSDAAALWSRGERIAEVALLAR